MKNLNNSIQLIGNLGRSPELIAIEGGRSLIKLSLATHETYQYQGEQTEKTNWHNIVAWGKLAENMGRFLSKGDKLAIQGRLSVKQYEDKEGIKRRFTQIVASSFHTFRSIDHAK